MQHSSLDCLKGLTSFSKVNPKIYQGIIIYDTVTTAPPLSNVISKIISSHFPTMTIDTLQPDDHPLKKLPSEKIG